MLETRTPGIFKKTAPAAEIDITMSDQRGRGRPTKPTSEKVTHRVRVNLTKHEYDALMSEYLPISYRSKTAYFRARLLDQSIEKRVVNANLESLEEALVATTEELHRIGVNINQIAKYLNTHKKPAENKEVISLIKLFQEVRLKATSIQETVHKMSQEW